MPQPQGYVFKDSGVDTPNTFLAQRGAIDIDHHQQQQPGLIASQKTTHDSLAVAHDHPADSVLQHKAEEIVGELSPDSHDLSRQPPIVAGAVQRHLTNDTNIEGARVIGWHKPSRLIPDPLIGGVRNGELFSLIRRFNKDVFAVRAVPRSIARGLDVNESWSDEYATDKLTLHLQRAYKAIILPVASLLKHMARLRSWKETQRTSAFCAVYFVAWILDLVLPLFIGLLIAVVSSKEAREVLFPPAPLALVNSATGGLQKPQAGQLGTHNTLTGAPEKEEGEAVEEEAAGFISNIRHLVQKIVGMHNSEGEEADPLEGKIPKPIRKAVRDVKAEASASGQTTGDNDRTKKPMEDLIWSQANPKDLEPYVKAAPHAVGEVVDNFERFSNAISPLPPFSQLAFIRIDSILIPIFLGSFFLSSYMIMKGMGFAVGFGIFGDPLITPAMRFINVNYPGWMQLLEPKNNILRGIPTNSQLAITMLRIGEANLTPLPPVPSSKPDDLDQEYPMAIDDVPLDATPAEKVSAVQKPPVTDVLEGGETQDKAENAHESKHKKLSKITRLFKGQTKAVVETKLAVDHVRAAAGSEKAKGHLGVLPKPKNLVYTGPNFFKARFDGKKGWLYITGDVSPVMSFTKQDPRLSSTLGALQSEFAIAINDIIQLKRATAFMSKAPEMAADWSEDTELLGSLEIDDQVGKTWRFTALPERDELFNRLVAIGQQRWMNL